MAKKIPIMTKFSMLLAGGLLISAPNAVAQSAPTAVTEFMSDYIPTECTIQFGYIGSNESDLSQALNQNFGQAVGTVVENQPITLCDAVIGTDSGESRNFNFIHADESVYKVVTQSDYRYDAETETYLFDTLGIRVIPITTEGTLDTSNTTTMFAVAGSTCAIDKLEEPFEVLCEFAATDAAPGEIAAGRLRYVY